MILDFALYPSVSNAYPLLASASVNSGENQNSVLPKAKRQMVGRIFCAYVYGSGQNSGLIQGVRVDDQDVLSYTYDEMGRTASRSLELEGGNGFTVTYEYLDGNGIGTTTPLMSRMALGMIAWDYTYDSRGNIESNIETISRQEGAGEPVQQVKYYYDELNQLVREDSIAQNKTITYSYDVGGNITSRKEYAYTTGDLGSPTSDFAYGYNNSNWKDLLTNYRSAMAVYDEIGNPTRYFGNNLIWQNGRQLASLNTYGLTVSYTYDDSGIRTSKTVNGTETQYYLNGSTILTQITGDDRLDFFYDDNGLLLGFSYNGEKYYYIRNLQNDIIGILDNSGNQVVSYTYDSWGKLLSIEGSAKDTIGVQNPFRYRGYYYDTETRFYYLNSRYYDPAVGRFLNADNQVTIGDATHGANTYVYCLNNPINYIDYTGHNATALQWWLSSMWWLCGADGAAPIGDAVYIGGLILLGGIAIITSIVSSGTNSESYVTNDSKSETESSSASSTASNHSNNNPSNTSRNNNNSNAQNSSDRPKSSAGNKIKPKVKYPGNDGKKPPGIKYVWKGKPPIGGDKGSWVNPETNEQYHPDLNHEPPIGPHWDYTDSTRTRWRLFPDGSIELNK